MTTAQPHHDVERAELGQIVSLWPAVAEAIGEENGMLSARRTVSRSPFPSDAAFVKKKAEQGRELVAGAVRGLTGHAPRRSRNTRSRAGGLGGLGIPGL